MIRRNIIRAAALSALAAVLGLAGTTQAAEGTEAARKPLMGALNQVGIAPVLDDWGIDITGHVEASYTYNFREPEGDINVGRLFDDEHDEFTLNQVDVTVARTLTNDDHDVTGYKNHVNFGFKMEWMYGKDARFIHSNGLFDHYADDGARNEEFDLTQAYGEVGLNVGNGLLLTIGKFVTPIGLEVINPTGNALYSHSFLFNFAIPFTHSGVMAKYDFNDHLSLTGGVVRGWDQSLEDNNDDPSYIASLAYKWQRGDSKPIDIILTAITGPEQTDTNGNWRTLVDVIVKTQVSDQLTLALNGDWGYEEDAELTDEGTPTGRQAQWYGVAAYATYKVDDMWSITARGEWFNDHDNTRGIGTNVYEATLGVAIRPFHNDQFGSNLLIRPEVRYDYSEQGLFDGQNDQITAAVDAIFTF